MPSFQLNSCSPFPILATLHCNLRVHFLAVVLSKRFLRSEGSGEPREASRSLRRLLARLARFLKLLRLGGRFIWLRQPSFRRRLDLGQLTSRAQRRLIMLHRCLTILFHIQNPT